MNHTTAFAVLCLAAVSAPCAAARAQSQGECLQAYERAQELRLETRLRAARDALLVCNHPECPALARDDCAQWQAEVQRAIPSIALAAKDPAGRDVIDVTVLLDGELILTELSGRTFETDPGVHTLRVEAAGRTPIEQKVVVVEGEKARRMDVTLAEPRARDAVPPATRPVVLGYGLAGVGALGLAGFAYFASTGIAQKNELVRTCAPHCAQADVDAVGHKLLLGDVSLGIGVVAALGSVYVLLYSPGPGGVSAGVRTASDGIHTVLSGSF